MPDKARSELASYLSFTANLDEPAMVSAHDELPLWSSMFGLMLLAHVPLTRDAAILDVGCGTGFPLLELAQRCGPKARAYGVDMWAAALTRAEAKRRALGIPYVALVHGDAAVLPFSAGRFDLAVSNLGINNFADPHAALCEVARVLKPSGAVVLTTNPPGHMAEFYAVFEQTLAQLDDRVALEALRKHIEHRLTVEAIAELFASAGLAVRRIHHERALMRFADGAALLNHYFIKLGFLDAWKAVVAPDRRQATFAALEQNLNSAASTKSALQLTIPMAYIEGKRAR